jgi:hypothetical protein
MDRQALGDRQKHFTIRSGSLLRNGFTVFEELDTHTCHQGPYLQHIHTWSLQDHKQYASRFTIESVSSNVGVFLNFWNQNSDIFTILLWWTDSIEDYEDQMTMSIYIPDQPESLAQLRPILEEERRRIVWEDDDDIKVVDRVSRHMKSRKSVSVALRNGAESANRSFLLDVEIDPEGKLPWPDLNLRNKD